MKRFLSMLLVFCLVLSMVACGNNANVENQIEVANNSSDIAIDEDVASSLNATITVQTETGWMEYYEAAKARVLEKYPDATINLIETGAFDHMEVIDSTDVTNPDVADLFAIPADRLTGFAQNNVLASLDAKAIADAVGGFDNYDAGLGGNLTVDGDYLAFPMNIETLIIFANTANAEANGIDLTEKIEFTDLGPEDMLIPAFNAWFGIAMTNSADIELLGMRDDGFYSDLTTEWADLDSDKQAVFTAMYDYWKSHDELGTDVWDLNATWGYMDGEFATGGANALRLDGPWGTAGLSEKAGNGADLEILPITQVTINGNPLTHWKSGWGLVVNARIEDNVDQMTLATAMIEEIVNPDYAVDLFKQTGKILEHVSAETYANSDLSETDKKTVAAVLESYEAAANRPLFKEWGSVWGTWENSTLSWSAVKPNSVEEAYSELKAAFDAMMMNY